MERKLAHIEVITGIKEIPKADKICVYNVLGWEVVDQKGKYNIGDKIIYCEIDSVLPPKPEYDFLKEKNYRIRTIKLKGQVSQGLILPLMDAWQSFPIGFDISHTLGITKYLLPTEKEELYKEENKLKNESNKLKKFLYRYNWIRRLFLSRKQKEGFPYWVVKTDEERCISGNTIIDTDKGKLTIKEICESNEQFLVKSYNIENNIIEYKEILNKSIKNNNNDWYKIELENGIELILTSEHPVYLPELQCYRQVKDLQINDKLFIG